MSLTKIDGDFQIQIFRTPSQGINESPVGVRITYIPTGVLVESYKFKDYHQNFDEATALIKSKI